MLLLGIITGILNLTYVGILIAGILTILSSLTGSPDLSIICYWGKCSGSNN
jgi:hypothetical protein